MSTIANHWQFFRTYIRAPRCVGALTPSSRALAHALSRPYREFGRPARVLEVGAGTGAITRYLATILGDEDELDVCEIQEDFADILEESVITPERFGRALAERRVRLLRMPVQDIAEENHYDFIISGLPLNAFKLRDVRSVLRTFERCLKPGGVVSYFEYAALRRVSAMLALGSRRRRRGISCAYIMRNIHRHQYRADTVWLNFPPATARHLRLSNGEFVNGHGNGRHSEMGISAPV